MKRIPIFALLLTIVSVAFLLSACNKSPRIDGSSTEKMNAAFGEMTKGLKEDEKRQLLKDIRIIALNEYDSCKENPDMFQQQCRKRLNGKSKEEIRQLAALLGKKDESRSASIGDENGTYLGGGYGHFILEIIEPGNLLQLEDESIWEIAPTSIVDAILWLMTEDIEVEKSQNPLYPYMLINKDEGTSAEAKLIRQ